MRKIISPSKFYIFVRVNRTAISFLKKLIIGKKNMVSFVFSISLRKIIVYALLSLWPLFLNLMPSTYDSGKVVAAPWLGMSGTSVLG